MKKFLTLAIASAATLFAIPNADARPYGHGYGSSTYVSGRTSCGCPVYVQRYVAYYDRCGHPVYRTRTLPVSHGCRSHHYHRPVQRYSGYHDRGCAPTYYGQRSGIRIGPVVVTPPHRW